MQRRFVLSLLLASLPACYGRVSSGRDASVSDTPAPSDVTDVAAGDGDTSDAPVDDRSS